MSSCGDSEPDYESLLSKETRVVAAYLIEWYDDEAQDHYNSLGAINFEAIRKQYDFLGECIANKKCELVIIDI